MTTRTTIPGGTVHDLPDDVRAGLTEGGVLAQWRDLTPLARNEFVCWITDAKRAPTRAKRIGVAVDKLSRGERRPCCWPGCAHRERTGRD